MNRLFEVFGSSSLVVPFTRFGMALKPTLHVKRIRFQVMGLRPDQRSRSRSGKLYPECVHDGARDVFLDRKDITQRALVVLRPEKITILDLNEASVHAHTV